MPERQIDTFLSEVDKPDKPEEQPEDIAQPELDLAPLTGLDVSIAKPKANFKTGGSFFRDGEYIPLFKVVPIYPRRAQERGTMGYALVEFTITDTGSVENAKAIEGYCSNSDPNDPATEFRPCTMFNSASVRAAKKLKIKTETVFACDLNAKSASVYKKNFSIENFFKSSKYVGYFSTYALLSLVENK